MIVLKSLRFLFIAIGFSLIGCSQHTNLHSMPKHTSPQHTIDENEFTKQNVYNRSWDGKPILIQQKINEEDYEPTYEIIDVETVDKMINILKEAEWEDGVEVDITPPHYRFSWNSFTHNVWINEDFERVELMIEGQSNYVALAKDDAKLFLDLLTATH